MSVLTASCLLRRAAIAAALIVLPTVASAQWASAPVSAAQTFTLDVPTVGIPSYAFLGNPNNVVLERNIGAFSRVIGVSWDVMLTAFSPSWLCEMSVRVRAPGTLGWAIVPGDGVCIPGTRDFVGSLDLLAINRAVTVGADGVLQLEFSEALDDFPGEVDGVWNRGALTLLIERGTAVPEPATTMLLGLGGVLLAITARRRRVS